MRYLVSLVCVLALGVMGCSEAAPPPECETAQDCDDQNECTEDTCEGGFCENTVVEDGTECGESTECTVAACSSGACESALVPDGTACGNDAGTCQQGSCQVACTEQGVRDAIAAGGGPYTFGCDGPTTVVTEDTILIDRGPTILDGEGSLTIDGNDNHLVFLIRGRQVGSQTYEDVTLELRGITITKGADVCGAVWNFGTLTLTKSTVSGNSDRAICNEGTLTLTSSAVSGNGCTIYAFGSGISNHDLGTATLTNSTVSGNTCAEAAGISNLGTMTLTNSIVSGNSAENSSGGIYNKGTLTLINSTVSDNSAGWTGGGIVNSFQATLTLTNSTVSGNSAVFAGGGIHNAQPTGGIGGTLTLTNSTVSRNTASASDGGGIFNWGTTTTTTLANSTVSGNSAGAQGDGIYSYQSSLTLIHTLVDNDCHWSESEVTSGGHNIESPGNTCGFDQTSDQSGVTENELNLGPLADNGGATMTHKPGDGGLGEGSVAIDAIPEADCAVDTDQRGEPRPVVIVGPESCDVGSVEVQ